jgi:nitronate monooxygenase
MGAGVSNWRLAAAVSRLGQLGVVSGTALDQIFARRLQDGDPDGSMRRGLDHFPFPRMAQRVWQAYYIPEGKKQLESYKTLPLHAQYGPRERDELCIVANFVEVFLARQGHDHPVGINYLEKIQIPHLPSLYGAMLAGVGWVLMGAGIPVKIPGVLDRFVHHRPVTYPLHVTGAQDGDEAELAFDPRQFMERELPPLARPRFLAIIASNILAAAILKRANGRVDGFVIEGHTAGGHNAPPRGKLQLDEAGEVIYGERDQVDIEKIRQLGLPYWLAGGYGSPEKLCQALTLGAAGIQVGTAFAYCTESGLRSDYKRAILEKVVSNQVRIVTNATASPTSFPFKVVQLEGSLSEEEVYATRPRVCDLGYLRETYRTAEGTIAYRCSAEPVAAYVRKGGKLEDTAGKRCLCNALLATIGNPQVRNEKYMETGLVTSGNDLANLSRFLPSNELAYSAASVIAKLLNA